MILRGFLQPESVYENMFFSPQWLLIAVLHQQILRIEEYKHLWTCHSFVKTEVQVFHVCETTSDWNSEKSASVKIYHKA